MGRVAVFAATSGIGGAVARRLAATGRSVVLIGRSEKDLREMAEALGGAGSAAPSTGGSSTGSVGSAESTGTEPPPVFVWDVLDFAEHKARFAALTAAHELDGVFFAAGVQYPQEDCERDPDLARRLVDTNLTGPMIILDLFAAYFRGRSGRSGQEGGFISGVSSVAGERGRGKVLAYAASKAGLTAYLAGLRHRLADTRVFVQTVKPGFVRTRMTAGMRSPLMAEPDVVAKHIVAALDARRAVVYTPWIWRWIMLVIRNLPEFVFRRMKF